MHSNAKQKVKVVFCWRGISGYMSACWRALSSRPGVDLHVISYDPRSRSQRPAPFEIGPLIDGLSVQLLDYKELHRVEIIRRHIVAQQPDIVVVSGWINRAVNQLTRSREMRNVKFVLAMDTQWRASWRQCLALPYMRRRLSHYDAAFVPGERGFQYALRLGFPQRLIHRGLLAIDYDALAPCLERRLEASSWPQRFLYVGRYVPEKGLDVLLDAYAFYRRHVADPWPLTCCGSGPLADLVSRAEGVTDEGFVQPRDLPRIMVAHGALVLPSRYEPWGQVMVEGAAAGLPVLSSVSCGASVEMLSEYYNGLCFPGDDTGALAEALIWAHENSERLPEMGRNARALAGAYSSERWADRSLGLFKAVRELA